MSRWLARAGARLLRATTVVDASHRAFDRVRSAVVARFAPDALLAAYSDLVYAGTSVYRADSPNFRQGYFNWEGEMVRRIFPPAPARVLVGGAGGGREAFALAGQGYEVVAFEPSIDLVRSMAAQAEWQGRVRPLVGRYEDLPQLRAADGHDRVDLQTLPPFGASMFGWASFSHIRHRQARVAALREFGRVTDGPVVVSFFLLVSPPHLPNTVLRRVGRALGLTGHPDCFLPYIGLYHRSTAAELEAEAAEAGLEIFDACYDESDGQWPWIAARRRPDLPAGH